MKTVEKKPVRHGIGVLCALVPFMAMVGYGTGHIYGLKMLGKYYRLTPVPVMLFYRPSIEHINIMRSINNEKDEVRISGYYAFLDYANIDIYLLKERYEKEDSLTMKRTIIWIMGYSAAKRRSVEVLSEIYRTSPLQLKKEIVRSIKRIDGNYYDEFIKAYGVSRSLIDTVEGRPCQINLTF